ncbi:MAG: hypothetical protein EA249_05480 [Alkalibacterium sp.]|nr:MAG: hypothetical protein EA249_05480 [Alkalibacterium sp.]
MQFKLSNSLKLQILIEKFKFPFTEIAQTRRAFHSVKFEGLKKVQTPFSRPIFQVQHAKQI